MVFRCNAVTTMFTEFFRDVLKNLCKINKFFFILIILVYTLNIFNKTQNNILDVLFLLAMRTSSGMCGENCFEEALKRREFMIDALT